MERFLGIHFTVLVVFVYSFCYGVFGAKMECATGWIAMHRACYKFDTRKFDWDGAKLACQAEGGSLVSLSSISEKKKIIRQMKILVSTEDLLTWWVGIKRDRVTRGWIWDDGGEHIRRVSPWGAGEPNNKNGEENCGELKYDGFMNDMMCSIKRPFICEMHEITQRPTFFTTVPASTSTSTTPATTTITTSSTSSPATTTSSAEPTTRPSTTFTTESTPKPQQSTGKDSFVSNTYNPNIFHTTPKDAIFETMKPTTVSVLTSTTWEESLSPFYGCFQPDASNDREANNLQYELGATFCPPVRVSNLDWPSTLAGTFAEVSCKRGQGKATWRCGTSPTCWRVEPNVASCASPKFKELLKQVKEAAKSGATEGNTVAVSTALVKVTASDDVSVEDVFLTSKVINSLATLDPGNKPKDEKAVKAIVKNVVKAGSNLMSENKSATWNEMSTSDKVRSASTLLNAMETTTVAMAAIIDHPVVIETKNENIDLELHVVDVSSPGVEKLVYDDEFSTSTFSIPVETLKEVSKGGLAKAVFMTFYKVADLLEETGDNVISDDVTAPKIASYILSASLGLETPVHLPKPVTFTMKHVQVVPPRSKIMCSFLDLSGTKEYGHWSRQGCHLVGTNSTHTTCQCDHMTNFAILIDVEGVQMNIVHSALLRFITLVGCVISIICLFASWITFQCLSSLQGERNSIHKNLVFCLFVAEILFVAGIDKTENKLACSLIAAFLHYFFLTTFTWMFIEGIHMIFMLVQVFDVAKSRMPYYYMAGYGGPVAIIAVAAGVYHQGYGTQAHCWLTTDRYFIWSFAGPVALILLANAIILTYAMSMVCRHSEYVLNSKEKDTGGMRTWVQGAMSMEVMLGLTWGFGYFYISKDTVALAYIFTVLNSLQGLFIFCFHCLLNKKVLKDYKRILHVSSRRQSASTQSASLVRKQEGSFELTNRSRDSNC